MNTVRIACAQFEAAPGDKEKNTDRMANYAKLAKGEGCDLILFPELIVTGYLAPDKIPPLAEPVAGPAVKRLSEAARENKIAMAFGLAELDRERDARHNSLVVVDMQGVIMGQYHKTHLWDTEKDWATPGDAMQLFDMGGVRYGGWICYDTRFPEVGRAAAIGGAEVGLVPTAWLGPTEEWRLALRARALDNGIFVAGADIISKDPSLRCRGASMIAGPHGEILAQAQEDNEGIIWADLSQETLTKQRERLPLLEHRRTDLF